MMSRLNLIAVLILAFFPCLCFAGDIALVTDITGSVEATFNNSKPWTPNVAETIQEGTILTVNPGATITLVHLGKNQEIELIGNCTVTIGKEEISGGNIGKTTDLSKLPAQLDLQARHMEEGGGQNVNAVGTVNESGGVLAGADAPPSPQALSPSAPVVQGTPSRETDKKEVALEVPQDEIGRTSSPSEEQKNEMGMAQRTSGYAQSAPAQTGSAPNQGGSSKSSVILGTLGRQPDSFSSVINDESGGMDDVIADKTIGKDSENKLKSPKKNTSSKPDSAGRKVSIAVPAGIFSGKEIEGKILLQLEKIKIPLQKKNFAEWINFEFDLIPELVGKSFEKADLVVGKRTLPIFSFEYSDDEKKKPLVCALVYEASNRFSQAAGIWIKQLTDDPRKETFVRKHLKRLSEKILKMDGK